MYISHKAIDRPRVVIVGVLMVIAMGVLAALYIPVQRVPGINTAVILVMVPYPGAQPTEVEDEITRKIEDALRGLNNVDFVASTSMRGSSVTQVIFLDGVPAKRARDDVAHLVDEVRALLPRGREVQPIITDIDFESAPIMLVNLTAPPGFDERALKQIAEDVQDELEAIQGVANTQQFGGREREIHVNVNPDLFVEYGLSVGQIRMALLNYHSELPAGSLNTSKFDFQVRSETKFRNADDIRQVVVAEHQGRLIRIDDIAEVRDTYRRPKNVAQLDGKNTATIIVNKEANINALGTAEAIKDRVAELQEEYPHIQLSTTRDVSDDISVMFWVLGSSAVFGAMLVLIILMWSMGLRISILVLMAIPFSAAIALIFLFAARIPVSNLVIFSFILVLGMVVDGAIIVAENIHRHLERGEPPIQAAKTGIDEVGIPVIAADLTTVAAFLPMLLVPGIMGDFMGVLPKVVSVALLGSVVVDHFLIPVLAAYWYKQRTPESRPAAAESSSPGVADLHLRHPQSRIRPNHGRFTRAYAIVLRYALAHRWVVICCCVLAGFWAAWKLGHIGFIFFPASDRGQFTINYELPLGYSIEETLDASKALTGPLLELQEKGEVVHFVTAVGSSAGLATRLETDPAAGPEFGKIMVQLESPTVRKRHQSEILRELRSKFKAWPGLKYTIEEVKEGPPGGSDVAVRLTGKDLDQLGRLARRIAERLETTPGTREVATDYRPDSPELVVEPDPDVAGLLGLDDAEVALMVQTAILGDSTIQLTMDDEDVTLRLQADPEYQNSVDDIRRLMLTSSTGHRATVGQVADIRRHEGLYAVNRWERRRAVTVRCDVRDDEGFIPDDVFENLREEILPEFGFRPVKASSTSLLARFLSDQRQKLLRKLGTEPKEAGATSFLGKPTTDAEGVRATFTGENEERDENMGYLFRSMIIGVILIFGILVIQFNSFRQTLVVLAAVPLSFVGVVFGMWVCGHPFSMASFIGLICLAGVVVNDAIVLVDFTNQARRRGMRVKHALLEAGVNRLRPVLLTTVTTIGGLSPLFFNVSGGAEFWQPLTGAVIFGLAFATVLTLLVIPVCYSLICSRADRRPRPRD
jgi:multidrug efflux pump